MNKTYPSSVKELESHDTSQNSHPNGFAHRLGVSEGVYIDISNNKISDTSITVDKPVVDLGEFYFVDFSNMVPDSNSPTGEYPYVCGQYGLDRGKDINSDLLYYSINIQIFNPNVMDDNTTTKVSENCATIDLRLYDDGTKQLVSDALFVGINCSDPITENNIVNKKYVDKHFDAHENEIKIGDFTIYYGTSSVGVTAEDDGRIVTNFPKQFGSKCICVLVSPYYVNNTSNARADGWINLHGWTNTGFTWSLGMNGDISGTVYCTYIAIGH